MVQCKAPLDRHGMGARHLFPIAKNRFSINQGLYEAFVIVKKMTLILKYYIISEFVLGWLPLELNGIHKC